MTHDDKYGHTGRELELMLQRKKPLSMFYDDADFPDDESVIPQQAFDRFVADGLFAKGEEVFEMAIHPQTHQPIRVKYVLYALREEAWRIPAMFLLLKTSLSTTTKPDEGLDRMESALLGYTNEQSDSYHGRRVAAGPLRSPQD